MTQETIHFDNAREAHDIIEFTEMNDSDVVRHELVRKVIQAYREGREGNQE